MKKSKKKSKKYGVGGSSNPLKDLNDMQALKRGQAYGSMLEGGGIAYKHGGPKFPKKGSKTLGIFGSGIAGQVMQTLLAGDAVALRKDRVAERDRLMKEDESLSKRDAMKLARKNIKN